MGEVEEKLAKSLTGETTELIPYLPYLLQDLWELGSDPEEIIGLIRKNIKKVKDLKILDLACGKGAVSVKLAKELGCHVDGIDIIPEFISYARQKAFEFGVSDLCSFRIEDINISVARERGYDIVIMGAAGEVLGSPEEAIQKLKNTIKPNGFIIIDDAYSREGVLSNYLSREQWLKLFEDEGIQLIEEKPVNEDELSDINDKNNKFIINRANELKNKYPDKAAMFDGYVNSQLDECHELENEIIGVTWLLKKNLKKIYTLGCCGLDCGLCPRFYTEGSSKCPGCSGVDFENKHPSCSFITCCVKKKGLEVCGECNEFPCRKFDKETGEADSFITHRRVMQNQRLIRESGAAFFLEQQNRRMNFLKTMLECFDDGKSKSFYCLSAALLSLKSLDESLIKADREIAEKSIGKEDFKGKARVMKEILSQFADEEKEELKLRKAKK